MITVLVVQTQDSKGRSDDWPGSGVRDRGLAGLCTTTQRDSEVSLFHPHPGGGELQNMSKEGDKGLRGGEQCMKLGVWEI